MPACKRSWSARNSCVPTSQAKPWQHCSIVEVEALRPRTQMQGRPAVSDSSRQARLLEPEQPDRLPLAQGWAPVVDSFLSSETGLRLISFLRERLATGATIYPPRPFRAL